MEERASSCQASPSLNRYQRQLSHQAVSESLISSVIIIIEQRCAPKACKSATGLRMGSPTSWQLVGREPGAAMPQCNNMGQWQVWPDHATITCGQGAMYHYTCHWCLRRAAFALSRWEARCCRATAKPSAWQLRRLWSWHLTCRTPPCSVTRVATVDFHVLSSGVHAYRTAAAAAAASANSTQPQGQALSHTRGVHAAAARFETQPTIRFLHTIGGATG